VGSTEWSAEREWGVGAAEAREEPEHDGERREVPDLTEREVQMLALERNWWKYAGAKEQAIRDTFGMGATHYYQRLNRLLDSPEALAHDPVTVNRLRRLRTSRQRSKSARRA
jgi:hypothetical protein